MPSSSKVIQENPDEEESKSQPDDSKDKEGEASPENPDKSLPSLIKEEDDEDSHSSYSDTDKSKDSKGDKSPGSDRSHSLDDSPNNKSTLKELSARKLKEPKTHM